MNSLDDLAVFEHVVRLGSFTAAARELGLAKSTVSTRISALEQRLGVRLLQRTTRALRPTEAGLRFYAQCQRVVAAARAAEATLQQDDPIGTLRVTCPRLFATHLLGDALHRFLDAYPAVRVELHLDERISGLVEEGFDVAIRVGVPQDSSLRVRRLGDAQMVFVAAPGLDLTDPPALTVSRGEPVAWRGRRVQGRLQVNSMPVARDAAIAGLGVAFVPEFLARDALAEGSLVQVFHADRPPPLPICALYPSRTLLPATVRAFLDALVTTAPSTSPR
jgi:DNA-binding transcriptional LysR family regulator